MRRPSLNCEMNATSIPTSIRMECSASSTMSSAVRWFGLMEILSIRRMDVHGMREPSLSCNRREFKPISANVLQGVTNHPAQLYYTLNGDFGALMTWSPTAVRAPDPSGRAPTSGSKSAVAALGVQDWASGAAPPGQEQDHALVCSQGGGENRVTSVSTTSRTFGASDRVFGHKTCTGRLSTYASGHTATKRWRFRSSATNHVGR